MSFYESTVTAPNMAEALAMFQEECEAVWGVGAPAHLMHAEARMVERPQTANADRVGPVLFTVTCRATCEDNRENKLRARYEADAWLLDMCELRQDRLHEPYIMIGKLSRGEGGGRPGVVDDMRADTAAELWGRAVELFVHEPE